MHGGRPFWSLILPVKGPEGPVQGGNNSYFDFEIVGAGGGGPSAAMGSRQIISPLGVGAHAPLLVGWRRWWRPRRRRGGKRAKLFAVPRRKLKKKHFCVILFVRSCPELNGA